MTSRWSTVRRWWRRIGATVFVVFVAWELIAFHAWGVDDSVLVSNESVEVVDSPSSIQFLPRRPRAAGLIFFPGALVDPTAYAPLVRRTADAGYPAFLVRLPLRGFSTDEATRAAGATAQELMEAHPGLRWLVAGHSKGGLFACRVASAHPVQALLLLGTTHPRVFSLSSLAIPVTKVTGSRDGLAGPARVRAAAGNLPPSTRFVLLEGGNHSQFGYYGFQLGDRPAAISREEQQNLVFSVVLEELSALD